MKAISEMKCDTEQTMKLEQLYKVVSEYELTHGLIAQSVRASEQDSVDVAQIPLRPTFYSYFKKSASGEYHIYKYIGHKCMFYNEAIGGLAITGKSHCLHITICIYIYIYILYIYIYIYILKARCNGIEKSVLQKKMMVKNIQILKALYIKH